MSDGLPEKDFTTYERKLTVVNKTKIIFSKIKAVKIPLRTSRFHYHVPLQGIQILGCQQKRDLNFLFGVFFAQVRNFEASQSSSSKHAAEKGIPVLLLGP